jgi:hypothetical protein
MKRFLVIFAILAYLASGACKKASGPADGKSVQPNNHLDSTVVDSANINGTVWKTDSAFGYYVTYAGNDTGRSDLMIIANQKNSNSSMTMYITNFAGVGNYPINPPLVSITYYINNKQYYGTSGTIAIDSVRYPILVGTYNFTADTLNVTGGFNVALP